jgi:flagellar protein FlbD
MIQVTRLDGSEFMLNAELIALVERTPDSVVTLINGDKYVVREPPDEIRNRVLAYRRRVFDGVFSSPLSDRTVEHDLG